MVHLIKRDQGQIGLFIQNMTKIRKALIIIYKAGEKAMWPIIAVISMVLSTFAFIYSSNSIQKTQDRTPIYITYPDGYTDLTDKISDKTDINKDVQPKISKPIETSKKAKKPVKTASTTDS